MLAKDDILNVGLTMWNLLGENIHKTPKWLIISRIFNGIILTEVVLYTTFNLFHTEGIKFVDTIANISTAIHEYANFWNPFDYGLRLTKWSTKLFKGVRIAQKFLVFVVGIVIVLYYLKPIFNNTSFPFDGYPIFTSLFFEIFALFSLYHFFPIALFCTMAYDCLYISFCIHLVVQFRILGYRMESIGRTNNNIRKEIQICVDYQTFLLKFFGKLNETYSALFMCQYFMTLGSVCSQLYLFKISNSEVDSMKAIFTLAGMFAQFAIYALPTEQIVTEVYNLPFALYSSNWQEIPLKYRKDILLMMMKSQNQGYISIGGFLNMNINTFVSVFKKAFSFYCVLDNIIKK